MMNQPVKGSGPHGRPEVRLRTLRILWAAFLYTIGGYVLVTRLAGIGADAEVEGIPPLLYAFGALGLSSVVASFVVKSKFYRLAAERQSPPKLQLGFIIAMVLCEVCVLLGYVGLEVTQSYYAYALFALGALGVLLHFPSRDQLLSAYPRSVM